MSEGRVRASWGALFFVWSLLAVFRAPTYHLWLFALVATEWGHWLAAPALLTFAPGWRRTRGGSAGAVLGLAAAVLFLSPVARAAREFGLAWSGPAPLVLPRLWLGAHVPAVREESLVYARACGDELRLQLYRPMVAAGRLPVVLVVHGGSWQSGSRLEMPELSRELAGLGYAVASIDYGLAPRNVFPGPVDDLRDAAAFLRARAGDLSLDMGRVVLLGRSAGGQIVLAAAAASDPIPGVRGVVDFYGPNDMRLAWTIPGSPWILDSRRLLSQYIGGAPAEYPERYDEASALLRAGPKFPPTLMIHGGRDELVWPVHELRLSARLAALGVPHEYLELPWATHGCDYAFNGPCGQITTFEVERFLGRVLGGAPPFAATYPDRSV
ncbi:MAG: alpha/beta hydrolase, partial [Elusimicrobia bacterium]|nr:alpha/beta hydrolase [Elusimicrobiota bacterium]